MALLDHGDRSPGSGQFRTNSPPTTLWIHDQDNGGFDRSFGIAQAVTDTTIMLRFANGNSSVLRATGTAVDNTTYWTIPVVVVSGNPEPDHGQLTAVSLVIPAPVGPQGPPGQGVPTGGTTGQLLAKNSATDYDTGWTAPPTAGASILTGTGVPATGLGAVGNFYIDTTGSDIYGPKAATSVGAEQSLVVAGSPGTSSGDYEFGMQVQFGAAGRISKVRYTRRADSHTTITVRVWHSGGSKLAEQADTQAAVAGTFTVTLPTPVTVAAGDIRTISMGAPGAMPWDFATRAVTNSADMTFITFARAFTSNSLPTDLRTDRAYYAEPIFEKVTGGWTLALETTTRRTVNNQTGTTFTPAVANEGQLVTLSNAAAITVTLPSDATAAIPVGADIYFVWLGVGQPSFAAGSGATVNGTPGLKLRARYAEATARKIAANTWLAAGDLSA